MKEGLRFDMSSGRLEKDSISLGCSVVRKNVDKNEKEKKNKKTKKRPRLILSDSGSDNDFFISPRKNVNSGSNQVQVGSNNGRVVKNNSVYSCNDTIKIEVDRKRIKPELVKYRKDGEFSRNKVAEAGNNGNSRMDVFEYNEDDLVDDRKMKKKVVLDDYDNEGGGLMRRYGAPGSKSEQCGKWRELKTESSRDVVETSNRSKFYRYSDSYPKNDIGGDYLDRKRLKVSKDDSFRQVSKGKEYELPSGEPVRIRGKNGVLKLTIKTKKVDEPDRNYEHVEAEESKKVYRSSVTKGELHPSIYKDKILQNAHSVGVTEKNQMNLEKYSLTKKKTHNVRTEDCQKFVVRGSTSSKTCSSNKNGKDIGNSNLASEFYPSTRRKVGEVRRGTGTQKQLIRERIRRMLEKAGWKIEFRPRKNRNYQDAVYTNPSGTEYWSILNAYYALKKEHEAVGRDDENTGASPSFTPLSEEVLSLLTRQTTKKIEREERMMNRVHEGSTSDKESVRKNSVNDMRRNENGFLSQNTKFVGKSQKYIHPSDAKGYGYRVKKPSCAPDGHLVQGKKSKKQNRCSLLVRTSKKGVNADGNDFVPSIRRSTILSWLIDLGIVSVGEKVKYMNKRRTHTLLRGWIARDGVHCGCCSKILTVSKFEIHAGSKSRQSYQNICVQSGDSLLQCQLDAWDGQDESKRSGFCLVDVYGDDPNDDTCGICADGGDLICCDGCPSTFHQSCLCMKVLPPGDWHCPNCSCKFCGLTGTNFQGDDHVDSELLTCSSCEEKYHPFCIQQTNNAVVDYKNSSTTFCSHQCGELFEKLQKLLWVKHELKAGFSWTLIRRCDLDSDTSFPGLPIKAECNSKLAVALTVMDECFFPIVDRRSGVRLIDNVIYSCGSNFNRLNFTGFYTAVLERGDEIISAASIRIHGTRLAEMPFIGTRHIYRRQGMCRRLLNAIESVCLENPYLDTNPITLFLLFLISSNLL